ncbi:trypsin-1-like [Eurosta solidaginis]|uniref:trypsin-1-like n=1 Tax=Eurosta solidaginis TaxID=178769 RepID=UPI003530BB56
MAKLSTTIDSCVKTKLDAKIWNTSVFVICATIAAAFCFPEGRIVNGTSTLIEKFPFMLFLRSARGTHSCGATIIAPRWILTAGYCVANRNISSITLQFASTKLDIQSSNLVTVKRFILHEDYDDDEVSNDIALLELYGKLVYNYKTIAPVTLPEQNFEIPQVPEGVPGSLAGWGVNVTGGYVQSILQEVDLKIYSDEECLKRHENDTTVNNICAGVDEGWMGQCNGDSGGPLLYKGRIQ